MPKCFGENYFAHGRFPEVGQKQKTGEKKREKKTKVGDNNGQATHGARKPPGPIPKEENSPKTKRGQLEKFVTYSVLYPT